MADRDPSLQRAFKSRGDAIRVARALGISPQAVSQWRRIPPLRVLDVERVTKIPRQQLRPDLYPDVEARP
ncbi:Cro/CI family transcriptional regulator [Methylobacterium sp. NMS12]|uniref:transcriptional regulator n=1 Tax=Methylobacterium sp. NMS12 TaxID=3079766 RepID=UPI003F884085